MRRIIQTKPRMNKEFKEYVINREIPDTARNHRDVWQAAHPDEPLNQNDWIHHINGNHDDNRLENLKKVNAKEHGQAHIELDKKTKNNGY